MDNNEKKSNQEKYDKAFSITRTSHKNKNFNNHKKLHSTKLEAAFKQVSDIRKFEIEMYWKRSTYFWALIVVAFTGYFAVLSADKLPHKGIFSLLISGLGLIFSFAWYLSARGSKYWLENWENHLDLMEDEITGPLYKTILQRPSLEGFSEKYVTGPRAYSVSKINQWVTVAVGFTWIGLITTSLISSIQTLNIPFKTTIYILLHLIIIVVTIFFCFLMQRKGKTHEESKKPEVKIRSTTIK